jgi:ribosomal protein L25 (general stress protein Ctc)
VARGGVVGRGVRGLVDMSYDVGSFHVVERTSVDLGRRRSRQAREAGLIPACVVGAEAGVDQASVAVWVRATDLLREKRRRGAAFENTLYDVHVREGPGGVLRVLPFDLVLHPLTSAPISVAFRRYSAGERPGARIEIPLRPVNEDRSDALTREGGWMLDIVGKMPVYAWGDRIPDRLLMDLRGKRVGDVVMAS